MSFREAVPWTHRSSLRAVTMTRLQHGTSTMLRCGKREHRQKHGHSMMTMLASSGIVRRRWTGNLSERLPIWTINMDTPSFPPMKRSPHAGALARAGRALRRLRHRMAECCRNRRGYQELAAMSDLELEDIGVSQTDIDVIFAGRYDRAGLDSIMPDRRDESQSAGKAAPYKRNSGNARSQR